jgi:ferredoxin
MMSTTTIAMGAAAGIVGGLIGGLAVLNFAVGAVETLFGKPSLKFLKPSNNTSFAFLFNWNSAKEPAKMDRVRVKLFNPFGNPTQLDLSKDFDSKDDSFALEVDFGPQFKDFVANKGFDKAQVEVEISSSKDGINFQFVFNGPKFKKLFLTADKTVAQVIEDMGDTTPAKPPIEIPARDFIADTVPGKGAQLAIPTNPMFAAYFSGGGGEAAAADAPPQENYAVSKVWIEPGCIVCNACEDIYPEVFDVQADTCLIRPNPPLDDGLRIEEAADACPVEVIKFTKA